MVVLGTVPTELVAAATDTGILVLDDLCLLTVKSVIFFPLLYSPHSAYPGKDGKKVKKKVAGKSLKGVTWQPRGVLLHF